MNLSIIKKKFYFLTMIIALGLTSCDDPEEFFSPIEKINLKPHVPKLTIQADWTAGSDSLFVFVAKSRAASDSNSRTAFSNALQIRFDSASQVKVELLRNGVVLGELPRVETGYYGRKGLFRLDTIAGTKYTLRVSAANLATVEADQTIQTPIRVKSVGFAPDAGFEPSRDFFNSDPPRRVDVFKIEVADPANEENYYFTPEFVINTPAARLFVRNPNGTFNSEGVVFRSLDPAAENEIVGDKAFNGRDYQLFFYDRYELSRNPKVKAGDKIEFVLNGFSKDYYLFLKTSKLISDNEFNPFAEPVLLHTNIKNGYGIFSIANRRRAILTF